MSIPEAISTEINVNTSEELTVIASEARQSLLTIVPLADDCHASLAMTSNKK
jgi:hypothetical protein